VIWAREPAATAQSRQRPLELELEKLFNEPED
jgi:hypothetical protein